MEVTIQPGSGADQVGLHEAILKELTQSLPHVHAAKNKHLE